MSKIITILNATIVLSCLAAASTGGFVAGGYWTGQKMEKSALAHSCGVLDPVSLNFSWVTQPAIGMVIDSMPDIAPIRKPAKGGK